MKKSLFGGLVAAVTGPTGWRHGSWVAAFLVLVVGVGQIGVATGQVIWAGAPPTRRRLGGELVGLNGGSLLVIIGTLLAAPLVVTVGSLVLSGALVAFVRAPRGRRGEAEWLRRAYVALLLVLLISTPVGIALSWLQG